MYKHVKITVKVDWGYSVNFWHLYRKARTNKEAEYRFIQWALSDKNIYDEARLSIQAIEWKGAKNAALD